MIQILTRKELLPDLKKKSAWNVTLADFSDKFVMRRESFLADQIWFVFKEGARLLKHRKGPLTATIFSFEAMIEMIKKELEEG